MNKLVRRGLACLSLEVLLSAGVCSSALAQEAAVVEVPLDHDSDASPTPAAPEPERGTVTYRAWNGELQLLRDQAWQAIVVGVAPKTATYHQGKLYITHGDSTVSVYDCRTPDAPQLLQRLSTGRGLATDVQVVGELPWVLTLTQQALPVTDLTAVTSAPIDGGKVTPQLSAPMENVSKPSVGFAVRVTEPGVLAIATGADSSVRIGDRFAIYRQTTVDNAGGAFVGEEQVAFAEVVAVKAGSALAELSRTALVSESDVARRARPDQSESNVYPVRVAHVGEFGGTLRPIVNAGSPLGVGALADLYATYWGNAYFVNVTLQPLGLGWTDEGNIVSTSALLEGGYDARAFSVGLGLGISAINGDTESMLRSSGFGTAEDNAAAGGVTETDTQETHTAFALSQRVRLGALDGLNLSLRNLLILQGDSDSDSGGFIYGGTMGKLTLPLDRRNDLFLEGGGGVMGYWLVGAGVGTWVTGNGSPGSWKLSISAGAAGIWGTREVTVTGPTYSYVNQQDVEVGGPMVSVGLSRRFGL